MIWIMSQRWMRDLRYLSCTNAIFFSVHIYKYELLIPHPTWLSVYASSFYQIMTFRFLFREKDFSSRVKSTSDQKLN